MGSAIVIPIIKMGSAMHYKNMTRLTIEGMMKGIKKLGAKQTDTIQYKYLITIHYNSLQA